MAAGITKQWAQKTKCVGVIVVLLTLVLVALAAVFQLRINIHHEVKLVGPEEPALVLLNEGRSLDEIKEAFDKSGKHIDEIVWWGGCLLYWAADRKRLDVAEWLLSKGANPNGADPASTPLGAAIVREDVSMVKLLIKAGADPDLRSPSGITPRDIATTDGIPGILAALPPVKKPAPAHPATTITEP